MELSTHGPKEETLEILADLFNAIDETAGISWEKGSTETWLSIKAVNSRSISKFIGKKGKVFNALRTIATVLSGVDSHRYMIRVFEAGDE